MILLRTLLADSAGATAIEYAFIASMISIAALVGVQSLGASVAESYESTAQAVRDVNG
jgi:Flp pilus assembly pilin Flp